MLDRDVKIEGEAFLEERYGLARERIREISGEASLEEAFAAYFRSVAAFLLTVDDNFRFVREGGLGGASLEELQERNNALYEDVLPKHYDASYANPAYAVKALGPEFGPLLSALYAELRSLIGFVFEERLTEVVIRMELFVEVYTAFACERQEQGGLPGYGSIREILYWFASDYGDMAQERRVREMVTSEEPFARDIVLDSDLWDVRYLFAYGEYVGENELETARFMASLPQETIAAMADTYTEGYRMGFVLADKDLGKKKTVGIHYALGFERMIRRAIGNFRALGLEPAIFRAPVSLLYNPSLVKRGFHGGTANRQYEFDHKDDRALFFDKNYVNRVLEAQRTAFEKYREEARGYAGPAVMETFGEEDFEPVNKPEALKLSREQDRLWVDYRTRGGEIQREYIPEEERSFTIIAFPVPQIRSVLPEDSLECYGEFFREVIRINTLDYKLYQGIQQTLIDTLDTACACEIKGRGENRTDLRVSLHPLEDPEKETIFENCVADVNIPVGEVFTSPVLAGTKGLLHVSRVFLNGLEYKNLAITLEDGKVTDYTCGNFGTEEENRAFIRENILHRHKTLPLGEFAIGTNTTAYVAARKYGVEGKLPILIAEKTGPHFALGDTCYSHEEDVQTFNPDGKRIVARENEVSRLRKENPKEAYFNCHTDITIPYDELGELAAVRGDGSRVVIIREGRFVLPGTEELNRAFEEAGPAGKEQYGD